MPIVQASHGGDQNRVVEIFEVISGSLDTHGGECKGIFGSKGGKKGGVKWEIKR
jgi:hypothetical protein